MLSIVFVVGLFRLQFRLNQAVPYCCWSDPPHCFFRWGSNAEAYKWFTFYPFCLHFAASSSGTTNSCINIICSKLLYAVLNRNGIVVAKYVCVKLWFTSIKTVLYWLMFAFRRTRGAHSLKLQATSWHTAFDCQYKNSLGPRQPPVQQAQASFPPCVKLPGCKAEHLPPYFAKIKNAWSFIITVHFVFMMWFVIS
jgi:hypothetical protein